MDDKMNVMGNAKAAAAAEKETAGSVDSRVALVRCTSYAQEAVDAALARAVGLLGGFEVIFGEHAKGAEAPVGGGGQSDDAHGARNAVTKNSRLVLKPNLLAKAPPEKACTTHPAVFKAAGKLLQEAGYRNLTYGDSPGNPMIKPEKVAEECGIKGAADALGIPAGQFEQGTFTPFPDGAVCNSFVLCDEALEADGIINLCKMKTHQLERITGAVKNTFGCVYGANKGAFHVQFPDADGFADMIADLNCLVKPVLHIMDGIIAMEGNGPQSGMPKAMNVLLVSTDPVALDAVFCYLVELDPELAPTNVSAMKHGVGTYEAEYIRVLTEEGVISPAEAAKRYGDPGFDVQRRPNYQGKMQGVGVLAPFLEKRPAIKRDKCVSCGICVASCPLPEKALQFPDSGTRSNRGAVPAYDYGKCIKCWCCQEMCPEEAIVVKKSALLRIGERIGIM